MDVITIRGLKTELLLGVYAEELRAPRPVIIDISLYVDLSKACSSDDLGDTVDYHALAMKVESSIKPSAEGRPVFGLIERLAGVVAEISLGFDERIEAVRVRVAKPAAFPSADAAEVEICRDRDAKPARHPREEEGALRP